MNTSTETLDAVCDASALAMAHREDEARSRADAHLRELRRLRAEGIDLGYADEARLARLEAGQ
jgi:hypothetical protein